MNSTVCKYPSQRYLELECVTEHPVRMEWHAAPTCHVLLKESQTAIQNPRKGFPGIIAAVALEYIALYFRRFPSIASMQLGIDSS